MTQNSNKTEDVAANTIRADELCALSGMSDRRLREVAQKGFYPPPRMGVYQKSETIQGLFKYFRESQERATATLRKEEEGLARAKRRKAELELARDLGEMVAIDQAVWCFESSFIPFKHRLTNYFPRDVSYGLEGKDRIQIQKIIEREIDKMLEEYQGAMTQPDMRKAILEEAGIKPPPGTFDIAYPDNHKTNEAETEETDG